MSYDTVKTIRVDKDEWSMAQDICSELHLSLSAMINVLIKQIIVNQGVPIGISLNACGSTLSDNQPMNIEFEEAPTEEGTLSSVMQPINLEQHNQYKTYADEADTDKYRFVGTQKEVDVVQAWGDLFSDIRNN